MTPMNNNPTPICYNQTSSNIISSLNCTCASGACMATSSDCPCKQIGTSNCICLYLSSTPCNT